MMRPFTLRRIVPLLAAVGAAALLDGCGRTLVFAESDGVNLAVRTNASSNTPIEVNFGLTRTVGTIVPPAGQTGGKPNGEAVNMFAGFEITNTPPVLTKQVDVDLTIDTQFASGAAAVKVAEDPALAAQIANLRPVPISTSASAKELRAWLSPDGKFSKTRHAALTDWLNKRYPPPAKQVRSYDLFNYDEYEEDRVAALAALRDLKKIPPN